MKVRLAVFVTSAASMISVVACAQSTSSAPATNPSYSERAADDWTGLYAGANFGHVSQGFSEQALLSVGADGAVLAACDVEPEGTAVLGWPECPALLARVRRVLDIRQSQASRGWSAGRRKEREK